MEYSSSYQVCSLRVVFSTDGLASGQEAIGPEVSHGVAPSDFAASPGLELKYN